MKKILLALTVLFTLLFTGCGSDEQYIEAAKTIELGEHLDIEGVTLATTGDLSAFFVHKLTDDSFEKVKSSMKYEIEGKMGKNSKMVLGTYKKAQVRIPVEKKEDFFYVVPLDINAKYNGKSYNLQSMVMEMAEDIFY